MTEYIELQAVVKNGSVITDVEERNNRIYFRIDGHLFSTYGNYAHHEKHPLFSHPLSDIWAERHNTAEGIQQEEKRSEEIAEDIELWEKHKATLYKLVFIRAFELLKSNGEEKFIEYIDHHFFITEESNNCKKLLRLLEKEK